MGGMLETRRDIANLTTEKGSPGQRLRFGDALVLFFLFETALGPKLPVIMPLLALDLGIACLVSAMPAIRDGKMSTKIALIQESLERGG